MDGAHCCSQTQQATPHICYPQSTHWSLNEPPRPPGCESRGAVYTRDRGTMADLKIDTFLTCQHLPDQTHTSACTHCATFKKQMHRDTPQQTGSPGAGHKKCNDGSTNLPGLDLNVLLYLHQGGFCLSKIWMLCVQAKTEVKY